MSKEAWHTHLPADMKEALNVAKETLGDFSEPVERLEILSRFATRRAVEGMAAEKWTKEEVVEMGGSTEPPEHVPDKCDDKELSLRFDVAIRANKEVIKARAIRLEMQDKYKQKAADKPQAANVVFEVRHTSPERKVEALKKLGRFEEARKLAEAHNLQYEEA